MIIQPHETKCSCGSGKRQDCGCNLCGGQIIHFSLGKRNNYHSCLADLCADLIDYAQRYYYLWESLARTKFASHCQIHEMNQKFLPIFWHWFIINYRIHDDVSPIIDFYLAENEERLGDRERNVLQALRESYPSVYQVLWAKNNTMAVRDIFTEEVFTLERDFSDNNTGVMTGSLLFMRLARIASVVLPVDKPVLIHAEHKNRITQEMDSHLRMEGINEPRIFLQQKVEKLCGLIIDLAYGKTNRIIIRTMLVDSIHTRQLVKNLLSSSEYTFLERNDKFLKYTWKSGGGFFSRLYLGNQMLIAVSEDQEELADITEQNLFLDDGRGGPVSLWQEGYHFKYAEEAELFHLEIMQDMYLEEWLETPLAELDGISPLQAVVDIKGRILLANLLNEWETLELRAQSRGEYFLPVSTIRTKLDLDKDRISRELLKPEAITVQVATYRSRQTLDTYVWKYQWASEEYQQVAAAAVDRLIQNKLSIKQLAWMLFMWNEFSNIYHPALSKPKGWLAALEYAYFECCGSPCGYSQIVKKYSVAIWVLSFKAQFIVRHFKRYPLDLNQQPVTYPQWDNLNSEQKIKTYDEMKQHLRLYSLSNTKKASKSGFYENINTSGKYWSGKTAQLYEQFFQDYALLDNSNEKGSTLANLFWEDHACRFPSYLKAAVWNLMVSHVGAYRVLTMPHNRLFFEDIFSGQRSEAFGNFSQYIQDEIVPGMIVLTRLLPINGRQWIRDPFYVLLPELEELFVKNFERLMERFNSSDEGDFRYLKERGECLLKAYIMALEEMEQNTMEALKQPLHLRWLKADLGDSSKAQILLEASRKIQTLQNNQGLTTFLWSNYVSRSNNQWGYVILSESSLLVFAPPGKDINRLLKILRQILRNCDVIVNFREHHARLAELKELEKLLVHDLAQYLNSNPEHSMNLLRQDMLGDEEKEYEQGVFLLKLGSLLMECLQEHG